MDRGRREEGVGVWRVGSPRLVRKTPAGSLTLWRHTVDHRLPIITVVVTGHSGTISPSCTLPPHTHQGAFWEKMGKKMSHAVNDVSANTQKGPPPDRDLSPLAVNANELDFFEK